MSSNTSSDNSLNNFISIVNDSLILLDVPLIRWIIICIVIIYDANIVPHFNNVVSQWFRWKWFRLFFILIILYIGFKDKTLALLLSISYILSLHVLNISNLEKSNTYEQPYIEESSIQEINDINKDVGQSNIVSNNQQENKNQQENLPESNNESGNLLPKNSILKNDNLYSTPTNDSVINNMYSNINGNKLGETDLSLNNQFNDPLKNIKNINQCNTAENIAVTDLDKKIIENPCSLSSV